MSYARVVRSLVLGCSLALPALGAVCAPAVAFADPPAQSRFAVIDTRRAVLETEEGLRVQANLKKIYDDHQAELSNIEAKLKQEGEDLLKEEKAKGPSPALEQKKNELRQKAAALQEKSIEYQQEMQQTEAKLTNPMLQKMLTLVKRVASTEGYDMVVDKAAVPYYRGDLDITDKVIQMYNAEGGAGVADSKGDDKKPAPKKDEPKKDDKKPVEPKKDK